MEDYSEIKHIHLDATSSDLQHRSELFGDANEFFEQHLNNFQKGLAESNRVIKKLMPLSAISELKNHLKVVINVQRKQEVLYNGLNIHRELLKKVGNEEESNVKGLSSDHMQPNSKSSVTCHLGVQLDKQEHLLQHNSKLKSVSSCSTIDEVTCVGDGPTHSGAECDEKSCNSSSSVPQFELKKVEKNDSIIRCPLHHKVQQKFIEASGLMTRKLELLSIIEIVLDQLFLVRQKERQNGHDTSTDNTTKISTPGAWSEGVVCNAIETGGLEHPQWPGGQMKKITSNEFAQKLSMIISLINCQLKQLYVIKDILDSLLQKAQKGVGKRLNTNMNSSSGSENSENNVPIAACASPGDANCCSSSLVEAKNRYLAHSLKRKHAHKKDKLTREESCSFYLKHKERFCRMLVATGKKFCGQHLTADSSPDENGRVRVPCPLDSNHSVYADVMAQHLKVCNARAPVHLPYYCKGINASDCHSSEHLLQRLPADAPTAPFSLTGRTLAELTDGELLQLISHVKSIEKSHTSRVQHATLSHPTVLAELESIGLPGPSVRKHLLQNSSLLAHLQNIGALGASQHSCLGERISYANDGGVSGQDAENSQLCFLEFGAGRGELSHWVASASDASQKLQVVLIDRGAQRYKFDTKISQLKHASPMRLRIDIADLRLEKVPGLELEGRVYAGGKHLCGGATDLTLCCLDRSVFHVNAERETQEHSPLSTAKNNQLLETVAPHLDLHQEKKPSVEKLPSSSCQEVSGHEGSCAEQGASEAQDSSSCEYYRSQDSLLADMEGNEGYGSGPQRDGGGLPCRQKAGSCDGSSAVSRCRPSCGLVIALCCHHKCTWQHYVGKEFFKSIGLSGDDFPAVMGLTSWAVCAARPAADAASPAADAARVGASLEAASSGRLDLPVPSGGDAGEIQEDPQCTHQTKSHEHSPIGPSTPAPSACSAHAASGAEHSVSLTAHVRDVSDAPNRDREKTSCKRKNSSGNDNHTSFKVTPCVNRVRKESFASEDNCGHEVVAETAAARNRYVRLGLSISEREEVGRAAKHIIDYGRVQFLRSRGLNVELVQYVDRDVTLENVALVARSPV